MSVHDPEAMTEVSCVSMFRNDELPQPVQMKTTPRHIGEVADAMSMDECLEQLQKSGFVDKDGRALELNLAFISLQRKAARLSDWAQK